MDLDKKTVISSLLIFALLLSLFSVLVFAGTGVLKTRCSTHSDCDMAKGFRCRQSAIATDRGPYCQYFDCPTRAPNGMCQCRDHTEACSKDEKCDIFDGCVLKSREETTVAEELEPPAPPPEPPAPEPPAPPAPEPPAPPAPSASQLPACSGINQLDKCRCGSTTCGKHQKCVPSMNTCYWPTCPGPGSAGSEWIRCHCEYRKPLHPGEPPRPAMQTTCSRGRVCNPEAGCESPGAAQAPPEGAERVDESVPRPEQLNLPEGAQCTSIEQCAEGLRCVLDLTDNVRKCTKPREGLVVELQGAPTVEEERRAQAASAGKGMQCLKTSDCDKDLVCRRFVGERHHTCRHPFCSINKQVDKGFCECYTSGSLEECARGQTCMSGKGCQGEAQLEQKIEEESKAKGDDKKTTDTKKTLAKCTAQTCSVIQVRLKGPRYEDEVFIRQKPPNPKVTSKGNRVASPAMIDPGKDYKVTVRATKGKEVTAKCLKVNFNGKKVVVRGRSRTFNVNAQPGTDVTFRVRGFADSKCTKESRISTAGAAVKLIAEGEQPFADTGARYDELKAWHDDLNKRSVAPGVTPEQRRAMFEEANNLQKQIMLLMNQKGMASPPFEVEDET